MERDRSLIMSKNQPEPNKVSIADPYSRRMAAYAQWTGGLDSEKKSFIDDDFCLEVNSMARGLIVPISASPKIPKDFISVPIRKLTDLNKIAVMRGKEIFQFIDFDGKTDDGYAPVSTFVIDTGNNIVYMNEGTVDLNPRAET